MQTDALLSAVDRLTKPPTNAPTITPPRNLDAFSAEQVRYIQRGDELTTDLQHNVETALGLHKHDYVVKRHYYIYSPPGAGKTFTVQTTADRRGVSLAKFQGNTSIFAFVATIAAAAYLSPGEPLTVWIDDCDGLFVDMDSLNLMKGVLDEDRNVLSYSKSLFSFIAQLEKSSEANANVMAAALKQFQPAGGMGIEVPTSNMSFIITSNMQLTAPSAVATTKRKMNEAAIRDRLNYIPYDLDVKESWGWVASQLLNNKVLDLNDEQKAVLLGWMWDNWDRLSSRSMRAVRDLAARMLNNPTTYRTSWNLMLNR
jgi:hypothetical protein